MVTRLVTLDELGTVSRGRSKHRPRNDVRLYGGNYPFVQTSDIKHAGLYLNDYEQTYNEFGLSQSQLWPVDTLCITIAANIADTSILGIPACFPDSVMGFIPFEGVADVRYVKYMFDVLQNQCKQISQGTAQDNMSWERLSTIKFDVPDYQEQVKVANILSAYDSLIENNQKQIKLLEEAAQRLYKEWFIDMRFPGYKKATFEPETGLPEGWSRISLGEYAEFKRGKVITEKQTRPGSVPVVAGGLGPAYYHDTPNTTAPAITISGSGANAGFTRLYNEDIWASDCSYVDSSNCENIYFVFETVLLLGNGFKHLQRGSAQPHVYPKNINELVIVLPPNEVLGKYERVASTLFAETRMLEKQCMDAEEVRNRLLPKLMSGEIKAWPCQ